MTGNVGFSIIWCFQNAMEIRFLSFLFLSAFYKREILNFEWSICGNILFQSDLRLCLFKSGSIWCFCTLDVCVKLFLRSGDGMAKQCGAFCLLCVLLRSVFTVTVKATLFCSCWSNLISLIMNISKWNISIWMSALAAVTEDKYDKGSFQNQID